MWTISTRECESSAGADGCSHGNDAEGGAEVEAGPVDGGCGLADKSDGDLSAARQGVEYWHFRSTVVQFMQFGRVSSHLMCLFLHSRHPFLDFL
jgi:hypothetical protein